MLYDKDVKRKGESGEIRGSLENRRFFDRR